MKIIFKNATAKNFLSIGNQTQAIDFERESITLVLGENLDRGSAGSGNRNGVGKTTMLNALSYALFGQALTNIKKENLINKINKKNMLVTVEFSVDNINYRIERGRKPNILKLYIDNQEQISNLDDEAQGDSRDTQRFIEQCIGISHTMFKHIVALNTYSEPFLSMRAADQRDFIEQLLGITTLSEKAERLKEKIKEVKDKILSEQMLIESIKTTNNNVQKTIENLNLKSQAWNNKQMSDINYLAESIATLEQLDINNELANHQKLEEWLTQYNKIAELTKQKAMYEATLSQAVKTVDKYINQLDILSQKTCPQCQQSLQDHEHDKLTEDTKKALTESQEYLSTINSNINTIASQLDKLKIVQTKPTVYYDTYKEALDHQNRLSNLEKTLEIKVGEVDPYQEQIKELKNTALQPINWDNINSLTSLKEHQEFLLKLLTNKESFIRKKIINQSLDYLNYRLTYYLEKLGLSHRVKFLDDLSVEITEFGQDLDFDNLSRGERNRLILSFSFAFRDFWENLHQGINLLFVDELIDWGMDSAGVETSLNLLKAIAHERKKNVFLISHREELMGRVSSVMRVTKANGFTTYTNSSEYTGIA